MFLTATSLFSAKIEDNKEEIASQQNVQDSEDLFDPDVKETRPNDDIDSDSKESTEIQAVFETVPAIVDPDSTEGNLK